MKTSASICRSKYLRWALPLIEEPSGAEDDNVKKWSRLPWNTLFLAVLTILGLAASVVNHVRWRHPILLACSITWAVTLLALTVLRPRTFSLILGALYVALTACHTVILTKSRGRHSNGLAWGIASIVLAFISLVTILNMPLRHPFRSRDGISRPFTIPTAELRSPEDNLSMWQWMTVSWMTPMIALGSRRQLNDNDVWQLAYEFQHSQLHDAFSNLTGSVVTRLLKASWTDLVVLTSLSLIDLTASYSVPIITQKLLQAMQSLDRYKSPAVTWAVLILVAELVTAQSAVFGTWYGRRAYEKSRGAMITMIHEKVLNRKIIGGKPKNESEKDRGERVVEVESNDQPVDEEQQQSPNDNDAASRPMMKKLVELFRSRQSKSQPDVKEPASMGKILNLMRNDVYEVAQRFWEFQTLLNAPIGLIISLVLVWRIVGWPSLMGIAVVVAGQVINAFLAKGLLNCEMTRRKATDQKLQQITQYIEGIRHLRWYGWHTRKIDTLLTARQKELRLIVQTYLWRNAIFFINTFASGILPVVAFWAYTRLAGRDLTVDIAFPALQVFELLQTNLSDIPQLITVLLNASVAVGRIEDFMSEPDVAVENASESGERLELEHASFAWPGVRSNVLHKVNVSFLAGLNVVVGEVASGKTALLQALLGELDLREGRLIRPDTPMGYCSQTPWLESMTIRDNILFCSPYDETRYKTVLEACALLPDLATFSQGDLSPIGENGIGLSGGQKARVALARAFYSQSRILLLDDPLSALDQQTAEWIVSRCFSGNLIKDRTIILVTHRVDICQGISEQIVQLSNGIARVYHDTTDLGEGILYLTKTESVTEEQKQAQESAAIKDKFEDEEFRAHGGLKWRVYWEYIKAGQLKWWALIALAAVLWRLLNYAQTWFLKEWGEAYRTSGQHILLTLQRYNIHSIQASSAGQFFRDLPHPDKNPDPWLLWFMAIVVFQALAYLFSQMMMVVITYTVGRHMFRSIMFRISNATFRFYDVTPVGRLMNRMTGDVSTIDGAMAVQLRNFGWEAIAWTISLVVIATIAPIFTVVSIGMSAAFMYIFNRFIPTSQSLRRLEMVSLSPLMSNFGALLTGLTTVRAFHAQSQFRDRVIRVTDAFQKQDHFYWSLQSWLTYRFQVLSAVSTLSLTLLAIFSGFSPGLTAFVLLASQRFVMSTFRVCKQYGQLQLDFVSVERVVELLDLDQEDQGDIDPPAYWPLLSSNISAVQFEDVTVRYAPHLDSALKNISFSIPSGSSAAIVGRTGSGKSTLALSLLATIKPDSGRILVDGIDIARVSKQALRSRVTFLAQDPILFQGTIQTNLDPMEDYADEECTSVLRRIHGDTKYGWNLETSVEAGGKNLSQGQRQLIGLARAMLRRSAIIIMDEATASVDLQTSWEIQRVLKEELAGSTVITIAHRASAVRDCDLVVKLDKGSLAAFGSPNEIEVGGDLNVKDDLQMADEAVTSGESTMRMISESSSKGKASKVPSLEDDIRADDKDHGVSSGQSTTRVGSESSQERRSATASNERIEIVQLSSAKDPVQATERTTPTVEQSSVLVESQAPSHKPETSAIANVPENSHARGTDAVIEDPAIQAEVESFQREPTSQVYVLNTKEEPVVGREPLNGAKITQNFEPEQLEDASSDISPEAEVKKVSQATSEMDTEQPRSTDPEIDRGGETQSTGKVEVDSTDTNTQRGSTPKDQSHTSQTMFSDTDKATGQSKTSSHIEIQDGMEQSSSSTKLTEKPTATNDMFTRSSTSTAQTDPQITTPSQEDSNINNHTKNRTYTHTSSSRENTETQSSSRDQSRHRLEVATNSSTRSGSRTSRKSGRGGVGDGFGDSDMVIF